ncbi:MAG TPA: hypothetical protein VFO03_08040 [Gaiellaceae bacterium]|nr:hypothetical protein [Gaiellaceae bacterium]
MTGDQALAELFDVSEDVLAAAILDPHGRPLAASVGDEAAGRAAELASVILAYADALRTGASAARLEAVTSEGHVFLVREETGTVVATTGRDPVAGLVYHDLRATLRKLRSRSRGRARASA